jgi:DNA-binding CsgD family transcriptional regulator
MTAGPASTSSRPLTHAEARIARLVATGRTNKEVAEELEITAKTVEWNLTRVYRKLGVRSRAELAARYGRGFPVGRDAATNEPFGRLSRPFASDINRPQRWGRRGREERCD